MTLQEAKERVERELFLAYDEEIEAEVVTLDVYTDEGVEYEQVTQLIESDRAKKLREAMETVSDL